jgi:hypothetical protein
MQGMELENRPSGQDGEWYGSYFSLLLCDSAASIWLCL